MLQGTEVPSPMSRHGPSDQRGVAAHDRDASTPRIAGSILVVDDDRAVLELIARVLRRSGAEVVAVSSGREAIRAIADGTSRPAVLVTDIEMPTMSGIELAARVGAMRPGIRVVMMTGDPASADAARARPDLVAAVLLKPVTSAELLEATGLGDGTQNDR
jgi:CheY-like chemotaxis protein